MTTITTLHLGHDVAYLTAGQHARGCVGAMSYYNASGEPPGQWVGKGAVALGLTGQVDPAVVARLYQHNIGPGGELLVNRRQSRAVGEREQAAVAAYRAAHPYASATDLAEVRAAERGKDPHQVPYFDLTVDAVKSVSVLHASYRVAARQARDRGEQDQAAMLDARADEIEAALMDAAREAVAWLERHAAYTRTGHHSVRTGEWRDGDGLVASVFLHHISRDGDPHLHVHIAVWNRDHRPRPGHRNRTAPRQPRTGPPAPSGDPRPGNTRRTQDHPRHDPRRAGGPDPRRDRALASAPPDISRELRLTAQAEADSWQQSADAEVKHDSVASAGAMALARYLAAQREQLEAANARYETWATDTSSRREAAEKASAELQRRGLAQQIAGQRQAEPEDEPQTMVEWWRQLEADLAAVDRAIEHEHQAAIAAGKAWPPERHPSPRLSPCRSRTAVPEPGRKPMASPARTIRQPSLAGYLVRPPR